MRTFSSCFALFLLLTSCGGGAASSGPAKSVEGSDASGQERDSSPSAGAEEESGNEAASEPPKGPSCEDGTCSICGASICPSGWYCDEKAGACSWLTECAEKPSCSCVGRVLGAACKCREEGGGLKVACD